MNLLKNILILTEIVYHLKNKKKKKMFNELVEESYSEFRSSEKIINPENLIYTYKTERISRKDFINYQNSIELFKDFRDGNINPKEVLKYQINFKSDLGEIKRKSKIQIKRLNKCNTKC